RGQIRSREATLFRADGVVFLFSSIGKPPRPRDDRTLREIFLIARPPLLAVMQGGEYASAYNSFTPAEAGAYIHAFFFFTSRARNACCWRNSFNGRTGVPHKTSPPRTCLPLSTPPCPPMIV